MPQASKNYLNSLKKICTEKGVFQPVKFIAYVYLDLQTLMIDRKPIEYLLAQKSANLISTDSVSEFLCKSKDIDIISAAKSFHNPSFKDDVIEEVLKQMKQKNHRWSKSRRRKQLQMRKSRYPENWSRVRGSVQGGAPGLRRK